MIYAFEEFEFDTALFELRSPDGVVEIEPQVFNVMRYLIEHRDVVVTKEAVLDAIWGDRFVSESALTSRIKSARKAVGDDGRTQRVIHTVHGRGYRFVAAVRVLPRGEATLSVEAGDEHASATRIIKPELVERDHARSHVAALIDHAIRSRRGAVTVISGEAGIGKTALVDALRRDARDEAVLLVGGCDDLATPRAMGPIHDIAFDVGGSLRSAMDGGDREQVTAELLRMLSERPTVLVIEDLHWADDATLDVVRLLSRRIAELPAVMILTCRAESAQVPARVRAALGALTGPHVSRIELEPLSLEGIAQLVGDCGDVAALHTLTHGNPFLLSELLRAPGASVPATVRDSVLARLVRLTPAAQALLSRLSVIPTRAERWLVEALGADAGESLTSAQRHGLVTGDGAHVWFRHELVRRAVESTLTTEERVRASAVIIDVLVQHDEIEPSRIVHHAAQARDIDALLRYGPAAARDAARLGSHSEAVEHYRSVLEHRERLDIRDAAACTTGLGYSLYLLDQFTAAAEAAEGAVCVGEQAGDASLLADALSVLSRAAMFARGPSVARAAAARQVEVLEGGADEARLAQALCDLARTCSNLSTLGPVADPCVEALAATERALDLAERLSRTDIASQALTYRGTSRLALDDLGGLDDLERALELSRGHRPEVFVRCCVNAAGGASRIGRFDDAERYIELGLGMSVEGEFHAGAYRLVLTREAMRLAHGQWDLAEAGLRELITTPDDPGIMRPLARSLLARILARRGDPDGARRVLQPALEVAGQSDEIQLVAPVATAEVELLWLSGDAHGAPPLATAALTLSTDAGGTAARAELSRYLQRIGADVEPPRDAPGPWAPALAGDWRAAATAWAAIGEPYEQALELLSSGDAGDAAEGRRLLSGLDASAALAVADGALPRGARDQDA